MKFLKKQITSQWPLVCLTAIGLLIALKLLHIDYMVNYSDLEYKSFCNINATFDCDAVTGSKYSHVGKLPVAFLGVVTNFFLLFFLLLIGRKENFNTEEKFILISIFGILSLTCIVLGLISTFLIGSICLMCVSYWISILIQLILALKIKPRESAKRNIWTYLYSDKKRLLILLLLYFGTLGIGQIVFIPLNNELEKAEIESVHLGFDSTNDRAYLGNRDGKILARIFTDYECPWCKKLHGHIVKLANSFGNDVRFERWDFPLDSDCNRMIKNPFHQFACKSAVVARCAGRKGNYWKVHDNLYESQASISSEILEDIMSDQQIFECVKSEQMKKSILNDIEEGILRNIQGTPAFFIFAEPFKLLKKKHIIEYQKNYPNLSSLALQRIAEKNMADRIQYISTDLSDVEFESLKKLKINIHIYSNEGSMNVLDVNKDTLVIGKVKKEMEAAFFNLRDTIGFKSILIFEGSIEKLGSEIGRN
ncbi:thioredoxin domain-containing protein, partial [Bacteriovoracaceae bacterium]|nr:thioredoxin domain-containing protein [Bacteriovoracaceae bacterium]